jgi:hypothetical protein
MRYGSVLGRTAGSSSEIGQAIRREMNSGAPEAFPAKGKEILTRRPSHCTAGLMDLIASRKVAKSPFLLLAQTTTLGMIGSTTSFGGIWTIQLPMPGWHAFRASGRMTS